MPVSRRRNIDLDLSFDQFFKLVCTGRGSHGAVELGHFGDNRDGSSFPVPYPDPEAGEPELNDEEIRQLEDAYLTIHASQSSTRGLKRGPAAKVERATVFIENPDGQYKTRLHCPRCGRDEQLSGERLDRLADAVREARGAKKSLVLDISWLDGYLGHQ
ncbi:hypothetical protein [Nocardiopsis sp. HUAS JQ3]|uniref:hypothetical protein n=1 Tax=Nocardiopsis sp. HUAS JQ3 TaxID=3061629 RepID=UPI0023A9BC14|nr:hypothetical protein [Nocardiopsis sp. HUAS JQ3]WDZ91201.1 hypothetical protein PV789_01070 [Nocardiopsis sp. HUAS JQ3]